MIKLKYPEFWSSTKFFSMLLIPISYIYIFLGYLRRKITTQINLSQKVICVGNITVGGTGKTQIVKWLAFCFAQKNISFVIITKAYKSNLDGAILVQENSIAQDVGDESIILSKMGQVIATKSLKKALPIISQINPEIVILDDGMQNPVLRKDFQILVFDSSRGVGNNLILPAGPLRETIDSGLKKADLIFMIGNEICSDTNLMNKIHTSGVPSFNAKIKFSQEFNKNINYIAFAAIGNPEKFYSLLRENGLIINKYISFEDHYNYSDIDVAKLINMARRSNCSLITTEKDYVKIPDKYKNEIICANVVLEFENEQTAINLIYEKIL